MTNQEFTTLLKNPQAVKALDVPQLKELVEAYPYFTPARLLYLRALQQSDSIYFGSELNCAALHARDRRWLYYFIYPEKKKENKPKYIRQEKSGDYFGMLEAVEQEGKDINQSLKTLAERLKKARLDVLSESVPPEKKLEIIEKTVARLEPENVLHKYLIGENYTEKLKLLMREKKYEEALVILKELNLNNPKKSIYFADQIRFLEKIIDNTKK